MHGKAIDTKSAFSKCKKDYSVQSKSNQDPFHNSVRIPGAVSLTVVFFGRGGNQIKTFPAIRHKVAPTESFLSFPSRNLF